MLDREICIALDAMGGDWGPSVTVPAAVQAVARFPQLRLHLVGHKPTILECAKNYREMSGGKTAAAAATAKALLKAPGRGETAALPPRIDITHTFEQVHDSDEPGKALRRGRRGLPSSMYEAADLVRRGQAQAMVSAGNTGALVMIGRHLLKTIPGIRRPALIARLPAASGMGLLLDVGANPQCDARLLYQFAVMGTALGEVLSSGGKSNGEVLSTTDKPRIGLLNIGEENYKGTAQVRAAAEMMRACKDMNFVGFIEANKLFHGEADVVVCDGFAGNVTIKASAGAAAAIQRLLGGSGNGQSGTGRRGGGPLRRLKHLLWEASLASLRQRIDPSHFNGASLLGLQSSVIKSHGNASAEGIVSAIHQAMREVELDIPRRITGPIATLLPESSKKDSQKTH